MFSRATPLLHAPEQPLFTNAMLKKLLVPLIIEQGLAVCVGLLDTAMVSSVGEAAVSGVSLVDLINILIINVFAALATGGAVVVSQFIGARNAKQASEGASQLLILSLLLGSGVGLLCFVFAPFIMGNVYGALDADVYEAGLLYLRITALSYPFLALYNGGAAIFRSMGNSKISMHISILMNLINLMGNAICIFGLHMGVAGVAWPSVLSRAVAAALILRACKLNTGILFVELKPHLDFSMIRRILQIGIPSAFENSLFHGGRIIVVSMIASFGTVQITANAVANNLCSLACIPGQALSLGMIAVVGRCVGARDEKQTLYFTKKMMYFAWIAGFLANGFVFLFHPYIMQLYQISDETAALASTLVCIHVCAGMLIWPFSFVLPNALRAANDIRYTMLVSIFSMFVFRIGFSYILAIGYGLGAVGVWASMILDWICRIAFFVGRFLSGKWKSQYEKSTANLAK